MTMTVGAVFPCHCEGACARGNLMQELSTAYNPIPRTVCRFSEFPPEASVLCIMAALLCLAIAMEQPSRSTDKGDAS